MNRNVGLAFLMAVVGVTQAGPSAWPPFLPPPASFAPTVAADVERIWTDPTLRRSVNGERVAVPRRVYLLFVDAPDVTAAAAQHLKLARYEVRPLGDGAYEADDHEGARGVYRVLLRDDGRRVVLSRGRHTGAILKRIAGSALALMDFEADGDATRPRLTAYVVIDDRVAATLARLLMGMFGHLADAKLRESFRVTGRVAAWAYERPEEFCGWLEASAIAQARRRPLLAALPACGSIATSFVPPHW
jgi:hypothetical protein